MVAAGGFDLRAERDAPLVVEAAPGGKPASGDPVDDGAVADAEPAGDLGDGDLAVIEKPRLRDLVVVAQRGDRVVVERPAGTGDVAGGVEPFGNVVVGEVGKTAGEIDGRGVSASILGDVLAPGDHDLVGVEGIEESFGDGVVDGDGGDRPAGGRGHLVGTGRRALIGGVAVAVVAGSYGPPAGPAAH